MSDLTEKFKTLEVSNELFKDVKFYVSGEVEEEVISLLTKGGADQSKYFSDFVTHLICGENPEETDIIDATDVYEVPAVTPKWIVISSQLNRLVSTKPYLFNRPQIFASKIFCLSKVKDDLESLWALITYQGGKIQLNLDGNCNYLITVDTNSTKYEKALSLGPENICIVTPDWILECIKNKALIQPDLFHPRLIDWPKPPPPVHHESTTAITGFEESETTEKDGSNDEVANSTQALLEKLKQRMPWNQPEQPQTTQQQQQPPPKMEQASQIQTTKMKEIVPPNVVAPSFHQKQGEQAQSQQMLSHQQILQKLQMSQSQTAKTSMSNIPQQMTPEQQQMVQNALQQAQQNIHSQRLSQQNLMSTQQQQNTIQSSQIGFSQQNVQAQQGSQQQAPLQSPSPLQQSPVAQQGPRAVLHHLPQGQQLQFQQNNTINRNINRPSLQQLRGQLGTTQLQQQLLQQQQQRLNQQQQQQQQQQQNVLQRTQLTLQQQQLLQLQLQQGQISQARQLLQQNQQQINLNQNQSIQPTSIGQNQQILSGNQMINTQHLTPNQLSQLQNRAQQLNQQKLTQNHQISQLLAQRQAQLNQRLGHQLTPDQLLQNQQIGQPQLAGQQLNQNQQIQLNQNRMVNQNQQHLQQLKLVQQQSQQTIGQNQQLGQNVMDHSQIGQVDQQMGQMQQQQTQIGQVQIGNNQQINQGMVQNQQIGQGMVQNQQINQSLGQNQLNQNQLGQNQLNQGLGQNQLVQGQLNQGLTQNQQQLNQGLTQNQQQLNQGLPHQQPVNQGLNQSHQLVQGNMNQNQQLLQSLGQNQQLNESLGQSQQMTQTQRLLQSQQLNPQITQTQALNQTEQGQHNQQQLTESPRQQINVGLNHILNQQINQGNQQRLNQTQLINQQLNQLNQQLSQSQISHQQIPQSPIAQTPNQQFGNIIQQQQQVQNQQQQMQNQQQQILSGNSLTQVRQVVGSNQQIIQQQQFGQNQQQFGQQQDGTNQGQILLNQQQNQFGQQVQGQQGIQQTRPLLQQQQQQLWAQQQTQQQTPGQPQIPRQPLNVQQGQRVQWPPGSQQGQGVQPRQFIHLDAQTHNQLQKMPPEQQALFIARLQQKQRQLLLKQAQQRGAGHILIRGPVPAGLNPQQQMAWLQQQANKQGVVLPTNLQQQTVTSTTMNQQPGPSTAPGPSGLNQTPGLSPIQQTAHAQEQKLKQLRLQQLQREQLQKGAATPSLQQSQQAIARPMSQAPVAEPQVPIQDPSVGQSQVLVNPKTKTALANMLSIRLQSGGNAVGAPQDAIPEPSAAGTLRLMTAQHNASLNANSRPLDLLAMQQQRRTLAGPSGGDIRPPAPQNLPAAPQAEQQAQSSSKTASAASSVPVQHRPGPFYGHNPNLKLPEDKFFLGCVFVVVEVQDILKRMMPNFKEKVEHHGGEVEKQYCARVTHVLCSTQRHGIVMQALRDCKRCVTLYWLEDVIRKEQLLPPWIALHVPAMYIDTHPCAKHLITTVGFEGKEKARVQQMILNTGAKYTEYMTKHNTLLIAAKPRGNKCKKAKNWNIPILNLQWLTDILLGNYGALQQIDNVIYQQFSDPPNFSFDPKVCPNIMHGWKMPINISQDTYEKVKKSTAEAKKGRQLEVEEETDEEDDDGDTTSDDDDSYEEVDEEGDAMVTDQGTTQNPEYNIMFTSVPSSLQDLVEIVKSLGGSATNDANACTHLVMQEPERTIKLLLCLPRQIPVVPVKWLHDSKAAGKFLDPAQYPFQKVAPFNRRYNCDLNALLRKENRDKILQGKSFWVTPRVFPNERMVRRLIQSCGGMVEEVRRTAAQIEATNQTAPHSYFIVTVEEDVHLTGDLLRNKKEKVKYICNTELVFHAVMTQKILVDPWAINVRS